MSTTAHNVSKRGLQHGRIIGICGRKRSGKDSLAQAIMEVDRFHWKRVAFADPMKEMALALNPWIEVVEPELVAIKCFMRLDRIVEKFGWEQAKKCAEVRAFLQRLGTEGGRECIGEDVWVDRTFNVDVIPHVNKGMNVVLTDVRFSNEIKAIQNAGGELWRVERPGLPDDGDKHVSEHEWRSVKPDRLIVNDGSMLDLRGKVSEALWG